MRKNFKTKIEYTSAYKKPILILKRKTGAEETVPCPFCGTGHVHGTSPGHRIGHCATGCKTSVTAPDGTVLYQSDGYYIENV